MLTMVRGGYIECCDIGALGDMSEQKVLDQWRRSRRRVKGMAIKQT